MSFTHDEILECAMLSKRAYENDWGGMPDTTIIADKATDCQCFVMKKGKTAYVIFRGTSSLQDAMMDCNVRLVPFLHGQGGSVHLGFLDQTKAVIPQVFDALEGWNGEIRCTGHSLGASTSCLAAPWIAIQFAGNSRTPVSYIGFGCPRVGDATFKAAYEMLVTRSLRVKNGRDPVASALPNVIYTHVGEEAHVGRLDPHPEMPLMTNIQDHDITLGYVAHCTTDDPSSKNEEPFAKYALLYMANHITRLAHWFSIRAMAHRASAESRRWMPTICTTHSTFSGPEKYSEEQATHNIMGWSMRAYYNLDCEDFHEWMACRPNVDLDDLKENMLAASLYMAKECPDLASEEWIIDSTDDGFDPDVYCSYSTSFVKDDPRLADENTISRLEAEKGLKYPDELRFINRSLATDDEAVDIACGIKDFYPDDVALMKFSDWLLRTAVHCSDYETCWQQSRKAPLGSPRKKVVCREEQTDRTSQQ